MARPQIKFDNSILGKARLATEPELNSAGLLTGAGGIVFGRINNSLVEKPPEVQGHCLIVGGTGTGKSRGIAIPSLLRWKGSVFAIDIKGELSQITAAYRNRNGKVFIFDPEGDGYPFDPLQECKTIDGANELARSLIPEPTSGDPFWCKTAQAFLAAGALEGALEGKKFVDVIERLCTVPPEQLIQDFQNSPYKTVRILSSVGVGMPEKTMGGVFSELRSKIITLGADPNIERATSRSAWTPRSLEENSTVYLRVSEKMLKQYEGLWGVIVSQILRHLSSRPDRSNPPILILLDEFARLGKIPGILNALATLRSRNVHIAIFIQSMAQLDYIYSPEERKIIADNCGYKLVLSATDPETQRYFSDLSGQQTVWVGSKGTGEGRSTAGAMMMGFIPGMNVQQNQSVSQQGVPLIRPEEFSKLLYPVLFAFNLDPCYLSKAYWDKDPDLAPLVGLKPEKPQKMEYQQSRVKKKSRMALFTVVLLSGFVLSGFSTQAIVKYGLKQNFFLDRFKSGEMTLAEITAFEEASKDFWLMIRFLFSKENIISFLFIWLSCSAIILLILTILKAIVRRILKRY